MIKGFAMHAVLTAPQAIYHAQPAYQLRAIDNLSICFSSMQGNVIKLSLKGFNLNSQR